MKESPFLSSLDVIGEQMVPAFTASSYTYAVNVLATVSSITLSSIVSSDVPHVSLTVAAPDGTKSITSESSLTTPVALDYGVNALLVTVSGAEGTTVYSISITRADASSVTALENITINGSQIPPPRTAVHQKVPHSPIRLHSRAIHICIMWMCRNTCTRL